MKGPSAAAHVKRSTAASRVDVCRSGVCSFGGFGQTGGHACNQEGNQRQSREEQKEVIKGQ